MIVCFKNAAVHRSAAPRASPAEKNRKVFSSLIASNLFSRYAFPGKEALMYQFPVLFSMRALK